MAYPQQPRAAMSSEVDGCGTPEVGLTVSMEVEFKSPVRSGFLPFLEGNRTATGF